MSGSFNTVKIGNNQIALYGLSIRGPDAPYTSIDTFIFPLSPQNIRKRFTAYSAIYDTAGPASTAGVTRTIDSYGISPFFYEIEGTTGWDLHQTDGYAYTGQAAIQRIQSMLLEYAGYNEIQRENNDPDSYTMEFYDYFNGEFYQVEPVGHQEIRASDRAPTLQFYRFSLAGITPVDAPLYEDTSGDPVAQLYSDQPSTALRSTQSDMSDTLDNY